MLFQAATLLLVKAPALRGAFSILFWARLLSSPPPRPYPMRNPRDAAPDHRQGQICVLQEIANLADRCFEPFNAPLKFLASIFGISSEIYTIAIGLFVTSSNDCS